MVAYRVCNSCDFWLTCLGYMMLGDQDPGGRRVLRIDGRHYLTWREGQDFPPEIGYVGADVRRYVLLDDPAGVVHTTRLIWFMGTIPEPFRGSMPDNAVFCPDVGVRRLERGRARARTTRLFYIRGTSVSGAGECWEKSVPARWAYEGAGFGEDGTNGTSTSPC